MSTFKSISRHMWGFPPISIDTGTRGMGWRSWLRHCEKMLRSHVLFPKELLT